MNAQLLSILYNVLITLLMFATTVIRLKKTAKYRRLKKQTVNLWIFLKEEFEFTDDDFLKQLCDDNERLEKEVKVLKKEFTNLSFFAFIIVIFALVPKYFQRKRSKDRH